MPDTPAMFWGTSDTVVGYAPLVTEIDNRPLEDLQHTRTALSRPGADRFASSSSPLLNPAGPIFFPSDRYMLMQFTNYPSENADVNGLIVFPGNPAFRHQGLSCNVLFADGSVRALYLHPEKIVFSMLFSGPRQECVDSDFRRYMLMIKWPGGGIVDSNSNPASTPGVRGGDVIPKSAVGIKDN